MWSSLHEHMPFRHLSKWRAVSKKIESLLWMQKSKSWDNLWKNSGWFSINLWRYMYRTSEWVETHCWAARTHQTGTRSGKKSPRARGIWKEIWQKKTKRTQTSNCWRHKLFKHLKVDWICSSCCNSRHFHIFVIFFIISGHSLEKLS